MIRRAALALLLLVGMTGCDGQTNPGVIAQVQDAPDATSPDTAADADAAAIPDETQVPDVAAVPDETPVLDAAADPAPDLDDATPWPPECAEGELYFVGRCAPTDWLGCREAVTCDPDDPAACGDPNANQVCFPWAATAQPISAAAVPACVPGSAMAFEPGVLRIAPTSGPAGESTRVRIEGGQLYIGALEWRYRYGTAGVYDVINTEGMCLIEADIGLPAAGTVPVEVAYGEGAPWSLAGFFVATDGEPPPDGLQPGAACTASSTCLQAQPYTCGCVDGRCRCDWPDRP